MDFIEISAKTYDEAVTDALVQLGVTSDQVPSRTALSPS